VRAFGLLVDNYVSMRENIVVCLVLRQYFPNACSLADCAQFYRLRVGLDFSNEKDEPNKGCSLETQSLVSVE